MMQSKILDVFLKYKGLRFVLTMMIIALPMGITTAWLGAGYMNALFGVDFFGLILALWLTGGPGAILVAMALGYAVETWLIRDRANQSMRWVLGRLVIYLLAGVPIGLATLLGIRVRLWDFPDEVESAYFVQGFAMAGMTAVLFTLIERAIAEFQRREGQLKAQIRTLQIEVDEIKRQRQVAEIVETEFFQDLQAKATAMRQRRASKRG